MESQLKCTCRPSMLPIGMIVSSKLVAVNLKTFRAERSSATCVKTNKPEDKTHCLPKSRLFVYLGSLELVWACLSTFKHVSTSKLKAQMWNLATSLWFQLSQQMAILSNSHIAIHLWQRAICKLSPSLTQIVDQLRLLEKRQDENNCWQTCETNAHPSAQPIGNCDQDREKFQNVTIIWFESQIWPELFAFVQRQGRKLWEKSRLFLHVQHISLICLTNEWTCNFIHQPAAQASPYAS